MIKILLTALNSPDILVVTFLYVITSAITTFDIRMTQAKRRGDLPEDEPMPPLWVAYVFWIDWILALILLILSWKYALLIFVLRFFLKVLPILEIVGNILMSPFRTKR